MRFHDGSDGQNGEYPINVCNNTPQCTAARQPRLAMKSSEMSNEETFAGVGLAASVVVLFVGAVLSAQQ